MLVRASGIVIVLDLDLDEWYAPYVLYAYKKGFVFGYPDGTFRPEAEISRAEFSSLLTSIYEVR
ncbi:MAG: S-layer homology domain-containing protein [Candidatus Peregrinibacteria bacterium]|nr:S-layer homology domain-containing protein [Candidatus Peregrinibacteria bacterium]